MPHTTVMQDGSFDWSGGTNSNKVTTLQSATVPNGLKRTELAWLVNGSVRDGGITPRTGYIPNGLVDKSGQVFQGGFLYVPIDDSPPYFMFVVGGRVLKYEIDTGIITDLSKTKQTYTIPTPGPWTITLTNIQIRGEGGVMVLTPGTTFGPTSPNYSGALGTSFTPFVVPAWGADVVVTLGAPYVGNSTFINNLAGNQSLYSSVGLFTPGGTPSTYTITSDFQVQAFSPAYQSVTSDIPALPKDETIVYFCQAEEFLIIQAGDAKTLPMIWDGNTLRQSHGLSPASGTPEIPAASAMCYYMGRLWYAQGHLVSAGDIVKGPSGTPGYQLRDSVLKVTENPLAVGGDGFSIPSNAGNIRALDFEVNLDAELAQGRLLAFTRNAIHALTVPVTRADWIAATGSNAPNFVVAQLGGGAVSDRAIVTVNGDKLYQSLEPAVRSYQTVRRFFNEWGNRSISSNVNRILQFNDRSLGRFASGIQFENRMLQAVLPMQTPVGVAHQAIISLDFEAVSSLETTIEDSSYPVWEGHQEGMKVLQLFSGDFGGRPRAFAAMVSDADGSINVWELTDYSTTDGADARITMSVEFPAFTGGKEFEMKKLVAGELWVDSIYGTVEFDFYYRTDADPCWRFWHHTELCSARNCLENVNTPCGYPIEPLRDGYRFPITLPAPKAACDSMGIRPSDIGFQFQPKLVMKGWARVRGIVLYWEPRDRELYGGVKC